MYDQPQEVVNFPSYHKHYQSSFFLQTSQEVSFYCVTNQKLKTVLEIISVKYVLTMKKQSELEMTSNIYKISVDIKIRSCNRLISN